jgi:hypothetical protein
VRRRNYLPVDAEFEEEGHELAVGHLSQVVPPLDHAHDEGGEIVFPRITDEMSHSVTFKLTLE